jgi:hypothetical protein
MAGGNHPPSGSSDRGAVTVEAALALCSLAVVTALSLGALTAVGAAVRCTDAARELVRLAARGEPDRGRAVAARLAPSGARITLTIRDDEATAEVTAAPVQALPVRVSGRAVAVLEPADAAAPAAPAAPAPPAPPAPPAALATPAAPAAPARTRSGPTASVAPEPAGAPP